MTKTRRKIDAALKAKITLEGVAMRASWAIIGLLALASGCAAQPHSELRQGMTFRQAISAVGYYPSFVNQTTCLGAPCLVMQWLDRPGGEVTVSLLGDNGVWRVSTWHVYASF